MKSFQKGVSILVSISIPFFLMMTMIRFLFQPAFLKIEYSTPGFPADTFGFTQEDRIKWGTISMEYLFNTQGISFLADQRLPDGSPLYNERELSHMLDVKNLIQVMLKVWIGLILGLILILVWAWRGKWLRDLGHAYMFGGWLTLGLIGSILIAILVSFEALFTAFHHLFFQGDSWLFLYSDSLIRLFPLPLWQAGFIAMGILTGLGAVLFIVLGRRLARRTG
ncbi:integral membrane protein TIGR01906 [Longilinea arvoryzae]|uniref:Integral membrane protein TIGR01906 n=1 Tax=Longilinea arvoryzae TaxID=360412 RepID=A0A0S7BKE2_9CHLR|nr:TIGR01906 family membrane protein [Longilinea arvoryzae]GAP15091.1 integral membrane protein TIGR01906 [Longilinea arvoryzae]